ncbi:hypothetical protein, partial [Xanthomonas hortorum]|uniref:hypothetical protein n=1 Tax=Xanthomonas hortorum TaxID=56454 RepID=UPI003ED95F5C
CGARNTNPHSAPAPIPQATPTIKRSRIVLLLYAVQHAMKCGTQAPLRLFNCSLAQKTRL